MVFFSIQRHENSFPGLIARYTSNVPSTRGILDQQNIAWTKLTLGTIANFYLAFTLKSNDELPT